MKIFNFIIIYSLIVLFSKTIFAQSCDTSLIKKLNKKTHEFITKDVTKSYQYAYEAFQKSRECPNTSFYFESVLELASVYYQQDQGDSILSLLLPVIQAFPSTGFIKYKAKIYHKIGTAYSMQTKLDLALKYCLDGLRYFEKLSDEESIINSLTNIANIYNQQQNFDLSNNYIRKAEKLSLKLKYKAPEANVYNSMGIIYAENNMLDSAEKFLLKSTKLREELNDNTSIVWNYNNLGGLYIMIGNIKEATKFLEKAFKKFEEQKNLEGQLSVANNLGELYIQLNEDAKAFEYYTFARKIYNDSKSPETLEDLYGNLSKYYKYKNDYKIALQYTDSMIVLRDSIYGNQLNKSMAEMQTKYDVEKKDLELAKNKAEFEIEKNKRYITYGALAFFVLLFSIAIWAFIQKRKSGKLLENKNAQLAHANEEITHQKEELSEKQNEILDSINYAKKIQTALLASEEMLLENSVNHFILFKPKDIVSGDFTWATKKDDLFFLACCDSTGHGVPGAFMSLLNIGFLSEAIKERNLLKPGDIFNYVRDRLIETIGKDKQQDGFDGIILCLDLKNESITYAAANNAPILIRNNEIINLSCNKMPVGKGVKTDSFDTFTLSYQKNDSIYLFTDGYPDQFGGPKGKKFKYKQFEDLLLENNTLSLETQKEKLDQTFESWKGNLEQVDDVCIVGVKI